MKIKEVGMDIGFGNAKIYTVDNKKSELKITYQSKFKELKNESSDVLYINGIAYTFTEGDLIVDSGHVSKENEQTRILLWKGLYEVYLKTKDTNFNICMNAALDSYKFDNGKSIEKLMSEYKTIKIKERFKNEVELTINNITCFPECLIGGATVTKEQLSLREEEVIILDFGTYNLQGIYVMKGSPKYDTTFTTKYGMQHIYRQLAEVVKLVEKGLGTGNAIQLYLEKTAKDKTKIIEKVDNVIVDYLVSNIFKELDIHLNMLSPSLYCKYLLVGGGSDTLKRFLELRFMEDKDNKIFLEDAYYANAKGLYKKALRIYNEKEGVK